VPAMATPRIGYVNPVSPATVAADQTKASPRLRDGGYQSLPGQGLAGDMLLVVSRPRLLAREGCS